MTKHLFAHYNEIFPKYWGEPALTDYNGTESYTFHEVAVQVARLRNYFQEMGIRQGDKIALCGRNCANWAISYLAIASYGAVIVSVLHEFSGEDIETLLNHSDSRLLIVGPYVWKNMKSANSSSKRSSNISLLRTAWKLTGKRTTSSESANFQCSIW